jgi:hypothetical protein
MPKNTKEAKTTKRRTNVKNLPKSEQGLTAAEAKKVKGGASNLSATSLKIKAPTPKGKGLFTLGDMGEGPLQ